MNRRGQFFFYISINIKNIRISSSLAIAYYFDFSESLDLEVNYLIIYIDRVNWNVRISLQIREHNIISFNTFYTYMNTLIFTLLKKKSAYGKKNIELFDFGVKRINRVLNWLTLFVVLFCWFSSTRLDYKKMVQKYSRYKLNSLQSFSFVFSLSKLKMSVNRVFLSTLLIINFYRGKFTCRTILQGADVMSIFSQQSNRRPFCWFLTAPCLLIYTAGVALYVGGLSTFDCGVELSVKQPEQMWNLCRDLTIRCQLRHNTQLEWRITFAL